MKKFYGLMIALFLSMNVVASTISVSTAKTVSENFYKQNSSISSISATLDYTETDVSGNPVYYAFNINTNDGFTIISADDDAHPIIGYATTGKFHAPSATENPNFSYWMNMRKNEIIGMRENHFLANADITNEWNSYINNIQLNNSRSSNVVNQLCTTTWNQSPYYNALCPGGTNLAVTGCVATTMAQIMKFWNYPAQGHGSSSYCDCGSPFAQNYGTLSANYGTTTYNWTGMPNNVTSANTAVATLMYQCGVSVEMDYSPSGSGSTVFWNPQSTMGVCARTSYIRYFKYDSTTIHGYDKSSYSTDAAWITLLENELTIGRPIQYAGDDANGAGGHSWVCDGFDASNKFHMNWGWGGMSDGMFPVTNLSTGSPAFNPINNQQALMGIKPYPQNTNDAGVSSVTSPSGIVCSSSFIPVVTIKNFGTITLTSCVINYKLDGGSLMTHNYSGSLVSGSTANVTLNSITTTSGSHVLTCYTTLPNGVADANSYNDSSVYNITVMAAGAVLPVVEGFESSVNLPTNWSIYNPDAITAWVVSTTVGHTSIHSMAFNNYDGDSTFIGKVDRFYTSTYNFTGTTLPGLKFDVAYGPYGTYKDSLKVYYSTDCGSTWISVYSKGGLPLGTTGGSVSAGFTAPTSTQWRTETIILNSLIGQSNVMFAFENRSGFGNWIYIDNINISSNITTDITSISDHFSIYPNPANDRLIIETQQTGEITLSIFNINGQELIKQQVRDNKTIVDISHLSRGVYFVKLVNDDVIIRKIIKE